MWRNTDVQALIHWMREHNAGVAEMSRRVGFYGLDIYNMSASIGAVLDYLDRVDPEAAKVARERYGCLTPWQKNGVQPRRRDSRAPGLCLCLEAGPSGLPRRRRRMAGRMLASGGCKRTCAHRRPDPDCGRARCHGYFLHDDLWASRTAIADRKRDQAGLGTGEAGEAVRSDHACGYRVKPLIPKGPFSSASPIRMQEPHSKTGGHSS